MLCHTREAVCRPALLRAARARVYSEKAASGHSLFLHPFVRPGHVSARETHGGCALQDRHVQCPKKVIGMFDSMPARVSTYGRFGLLHCAAVQADLRMDSGAETQDAVHGMVVANH